MLKLGFRYETRRKGYYVDGHERKATVQYRWDFCDRYLSLECRMFRWIQVSLEELERLQALGKVAKGSGYKYTDELTGKAMVEYHVDTCRGFIDRMKEQTVFGGNLSVRMNPDERPLISFGQDECIVKQYSFTNKSWTGPNREQALIPKDDGLGVVMSGFASCEFGFGMALTTKELQRVNAERLGKKYKDESAAKKKRGSEFKQPLTMSPFVLEFDYGASAEGYWTYDSMVLQLEDCADVVTTLYPQYDFLFLFDHSCGHDRMPEDALRIDGMNKGYGGERAKHHERKHYQRWRWIPWTTRPHAQRWRRSIYGLPFNRRRAILDDSRRTRANEERSFWNHSYYKGAHQATADRAASAARHRGRKRE